MSPRTLVVLVSCAAGCLLGGGCGVDRTLTVSSEPEGALVYLNGEEFGRTPVTRDFTWYGTYDVTLRREGYEPLKTRGRVIAPWWQWVPFDLVAELLPVRLTDRQQLAYTLTPEQPQDVQAEALLSRANEMRGLLRGTQYTRQPTPATRPAE